MVSTALTYLELEGVIRATGPFYTSYQIQFLQPAAEILARFDAARADFLRRLFDTGKMGRTWLTIDVQRATEQLDEPRARILKALQYLEEQGCIATRAKGVRQGYRRLQRPDLPGLCARLGQLFSRREQQDLARLQLVLDYAASPECLPARLCGYFGETLPQPCGQCSSCREPRARELSGMPAPEIGPAEQRGMEKLIGEGRQALAHPRQLARFLCGLASPATARLRKHPQFGRLAQQPFRQVLALAEDMLASAS